MYIEGYEAEKVQEMSHFMPLVQYFLEKASRILAPK